MSDFTFDAEKHEYRVAGALLPSVTQILDPLSDFDRIPYDVLEFARERGEAVHAAIALAQADDLDEDSLDPIIMPYISAWRAFMEETGFVPEEWETPLYHPTLGYAGTPDVIGLLAKKRAVIDYKTSHDIPLAAGPQTAAYVQLINANRGGRNPVLARYVCRLKWDATYDLEQLTASDDLVCFQSFLNIYRWRQNRAGK